ncbi:MAG: hypothetical protein GWM98_17230 [Nitrospinaceae bacterium]|nr:hypothetical protein [Nitrospinaceae bacterium]
MPSKPSRADIPPPRAISVADWVEAAEGLTDLNLVGGKKGLVRRISEAAINRAGLALTGFYQYFPQRRIQVIGMAEHIPGFPERERAAQAPGGFFCQQGALRRFYAKKENIPRGS